MIRIEHLHKRFSKLAVLTDVSASFRAGQVIALIGPNGSGKTTLIKSILGMVKPSAGQIYFNDQPIGEQFEYRRQIGYMPQIGRYPDHMKISQVMAMMQNIRNQPAAAIDEDLYLAYDIAAIAHKPMHSLSGGTRQKISAILAFMFRPEVLILDEPTAGLDPLASEILRNKILVEKQRGRLILITSHILNDLDELATDILYLHEGQVKCYDTLPNILQQTGQAKLSKAIAALMQAQSHSPATMQNGQCTTKTVSHV